MNHDPLELGNLSVKDLLCSSQLLPADIQRIYQVAQQLKAGRAQHTAVLQHKRLAMIFEKDSLRTRFTFDIGMHDLGRQRRVHGPPRRPARLARVGQGHGQELERWVHGIVARTFKHKVLEELAQHSAIPVINGLSDLVHPCQALTDFFTLTERWARCAASCCASSATATTPAIR